MVISKQHYSINITSLILTVVMITERTGSPSGLVRSNRAVGSYGLSIKENNTTVNQAACTFYQHSLRTLSKND